MIRLFIENTEIELTEDVQIALTKQFENLSNPTNIINDWSKTISIPFTVKNNQTFGHIYNIDRVIVTGGYPIGTYFNPLRKLNFRLEWNSAVLMTGYAKLNEIKQSNGKGTYEITLFGQLGKIFQDIKKITFDTSTAEPGYLIDGSEYVDEYINKELVAYSWQSYGQYHSNIKKKNESGYSVYDIIGFAPNNSFSESFKYDSFLVQPNKSMQFTEVLGDTFTADTGISPDTVIPNGMLPREIGEYRSYLQLPFIYWNKLFQIFQEKAESITGYAFDLDDTWFNDSNPYWFNLVYMLRPFNAKDGTMTENANYYTANPYGSMGWQKTSSINTMTTHRTVNLCTYTNGTNVEQVPMIDLSVNFNDGKWFTLSDTNMNPIFKVKTLWKIYDGDGSSSTSTLNNNNALIIKVNAVGENGYTETVKFLVRHSGCTLTESGANIIEFDGSTKAGSSDMFSIDADFLVTKSKFGDSVRFRFEGYWQNSNWSLTSNGDLVKLDPYTVNNPNFTYVTILNGVHRSYAHFTLNDLWNNDYNLFEEILKYCKMYRISISIDELEKKIIFKPYNKFFENYTVEDWTNKIDMSKDYTIAPVTLENKYVLFNYEDNKTKMGEEYKTKYGVNYGEYRLITEYNFNSETSKLFDKVHTSIVNTDNVLSWTNLFDNHKIVYSFPSEIYVYNKDKDNKQTDTFGQYFFHNGLRDFSTEASLYLRTVYITDDTAFQQANNTYMYTQGAGDRAVVTTYPNLDIVRGNNLCLFNVPSENYTYNNNYSGKHSIYSNLWKDYIDERYNIQNKKITCYVTIKPAEYQQFDWNKLVKVGNQLCIVNKIYDYNITSNSPTKVDLITIQDISGYTTNDYTYDFIYATPNQLTIPYDYYKRTIVHSSGHWEVKADDWSDTLTISPTSGEAGVTDVIIGSTDEDYGYIPTFELYDSTRTNVIATCQVECNVGGTSTISIAGDWYTEYTITSFPRVTRRTVTSDTTWKLIEVDNPNNVNLTYTPQIGVEMSAGTGNITYSCADSTHTGIVDFWVENEAGDISSIRVNFKV